VAVAVDGKGVAVEAAVAVSAGVGLDGMGEAVGDGSTGWLDRTGIELWLAAWQAFKLANRQQHRNRKINFFNTLNSLCHDRVYQKIWLSGSYRGIVRILGCVRTQVHTPKYGGPPRQFLKTRKYRVLRNCLKFFEGIRFLGYSLVQLAECFWEKSKIYPQEAELGAAYA
jgi:hypothetical protein